MGESGGDDHISVGMRLPSGEYERPIPGKRLFWTKPGNFNSASRTNFDLISDNDEGKWTIKVETFLAKLCTKCCGLQPF